MEKLKVLLFMLVAANDGLAVSMYILALVLAPSESPLGLLVRILTGGLSPDLTVLVPLSSLLFLCVVLASMVGVVYFLVLPEMKNFVSGNGTHATSIILRTLKPDERRVVSVLDAHGGIYLQKYISKEADLSRLKTLRLIEALLDRGIGHAEKRGNTNEVTLASWFHDGMHGRTEVPSAPRSSEHIQALA